MATAGDPGREARADLSRVDPDHDLTEGGVAGDPDHIPERGTAEVRSRLTGAGGSYERPDAEGPATTSRSQSEGGRGRFEDLRDRAGELGDRAGEWATRARRGLDDTMHEVEERLHLGGESGAINIIRENPFLAAGLAFGIGFMLAGSRRPRSGLMGAATGQLRGAVIGGLTAAITQELRELIDEHGGLSGLLGSIGEGEHPAYDRDD